MSTLRLQADQDILVVEGPEGPREVSVYSDEGFTLLTELWVKSSWHSRLSYRLTWMGVPIIQLPEDLLMVQELVFKLRPDVIIETGTAHGGTAVFYSSLLELIGRGRVLSVDVEIRQYNRLAIQAHPMSHRITLVEGSSTDPEVVDRVRKMVSPRDRVLVALDSNHTRDHVAQEMESYAGLVTPGSYLVVFDGVMPMLARAPQGSPSWETDNPAAAVRQFLDGHPEFEVDPYYNRLGATHCPGGFLRRADPA